MTPLTMMTLTMTTLTMTPCATPSREPCRAAARPSFTEESKGDIV